MAKFLSGFGVSTALFVGLLAFLRFGLGWGPPPPVDDETVDDVEEIDEVEEAPVEDHRGRRRRRQRRDGQSEGRRSERSPGAPDRVATEGDDLREGEPRSLDLAGSGGEAQLSTRQIEAAFDTAMPRVRRCLVLAASDAPVRGQVVFAVRIRGSGDVSAVQLTGPAAVTTGEAGECLRTAIRGTRFPSFDGPEMLARFPMVLE